ncbi:glycosyl transferase [Thermoanaerobacterium thermosaccharolyticum]|uniref:Glycosyl transferase n=1 Tax=Thermoanaerobacterium thermosaccharolyticum TaxID=1517 RepID=A0A223HYA3_THETR|nr:glycosyl transferase [Thermoanaerobacterium thermosaccharolyticum]
MGIYAGNFESSQNMEVNCVFCRLNEEYIIIKKYIHFQKLSRKLSVKFS